MNSTSSLYDSIYSGIHRFEVKVNIAGTDYGMNILTSLNIRRSAFGSGSLPSAWLRQGSSPFPCTWIPAPSRVWPRSVPTSAS